MNKPSGKPCVGRLQARECDSMLEHLRCAPQTPAFDMFPAIAQVLLWTFQFVGKPDIVDHTDSSGHIMKKGQHLAMVVRSQLSENR
jgi:hypothetical protein